jgi:hypothetical protein
MIQSTAEDFRTYARRALASQRRVKLHTESEKSPILQETIDTVTAPDQLAWAGSYYWAAPIFYGDGPVTMETHSDYTAVRDFYATGKENWKLKAFSAPLTGIYTSWYGLFEARAYLTDVTGEIPFPEQDWVLLAPLAGDHGIAGELTWAQFPQEAPPESMTQLDRANLFADYLHALRAADADAVVELHSDNAVAASRAYGGYDDVFVSMQNPAEIREYWCRFFAELDVHEVVAVNYLCRNWYLFAELSWEATCRSTGERVQFLTVEQLHIGSSGKFWARLGFGTPAEAF